MFEILILNPTSCFISIVGCLLNKSDIWFILVAFCLDCEEMQHKIILLNKSKTVNLQDTMHYVNNMGKFFCSCYQSSGQPPYDQNTTFYSPAFLFPTS